MNEEKIKKLESLVEEAQKTSTKFESDEKNLYEREKELIKKLEKEKHIKGNFVYTIACYSRVLGRIAKEMHQELVENKYCRPLITIYCEGRLDGLLGYSAEMSNIKFYVIEASNFPESAVLSNPKLADMIKTYEKNSNELREIIQEKTFARFSEDEIKEMKMFTAPRKANYAIFYETIQPQYRKRFIDLAIQEIEIRLENHKTFMDYILREEEK